MNECRNVLSNDKVGEISEMKETRIIHSHTENYVLCVFCPSSTLSPKSMRGREECPLTVECGGWGMKCMMQSKVDGGGKPRMREC